MAGRSPKEKAVRKALQGLNKVLHESMDGFSVNVGMYGLGKLTYREYDSIRSAATTHQANSELISAFHKRGPEILDVLLDVLEDEDEANSFLIKKIKEGWLIINYGL